MPANIIVRTLHKECDNNPAEPAAIHAAAREQINSIVNPVFDFDSVKESLTKALDCNNLLWFT